MYMRVCIYDMICKQANDARNLPWFLRLWCRRKNNIPSTTAIAKRKMTRSTMMINIKFNLPVETFRGEDSLTAFSNVVPKGEQKKKEKYISNFLRGEG